MTSCSRPGSTKHATRRTSPGGLLRRRGLQSARQKGLWTAAAPTRRLTWTKAARNQLACRGAPIDLRPRKGECRRSRQGLGHSQWRRRAADRPHGLERDHVRSRHARLLGGFPAVLARRNAAALLMQRRTNVRRAAATGATGSGLLHRRELVRARHRRRAAARPRSLASDHARSRLPRLLGGLPVTWCRWEAAFPALRHRLAAAGVSRRQEMMRGLLHRRGLVRAQRHRRVAARLRSPACDRALYRHARQIEDHSIAWRRREATALACWRRPRFGQDHRRARRARRLLR